MHLCLFNAYQKSVSACTVFAAAAAAGAAVAVLSVSTAADADAVCAVSADAAVAKAICVLSESVSQIPSIVTVFKEGMIVDMLKVCCLLSGRKIAHQHQ